MEKVSERWSPNGITSTFKVLLEGDRPPYREQAVYSDICGFGWRFGIRACLKTIRIYFNPHLLQCADFGIISLSAIHISERGIATKVQQELDYRLDGCNHYQCGTRLAARSCSTFYKGLDDDPPDRDNDNPSFASYAADYFAKSPFLKLTVAFPTSLRLPPIPDPIPSETKRLVNELLLGRLSVDTKFFLFSRRMPSRRAGSPLPLFMSSSVLKGLKGHLSYLDTLLFEEGFKESTPVDLLTTEAELQDDSYYESDSDLESNSQDNYESCDSEQSSDIGDTPNLASSLPPRDALCKSLKPDTSSTYVSQTSRPITEAPSNEVPSSSQLNGVQHGGHPQQMGRIISKKHTAFATWRALLFYLHTKDISFSPLKSRRTIPPPLSHETTVDELSKTPSCSPKSMYRLANEIGLTDLKELAFQAIASDLTEDNIVRELFSEFTCRHPEIQAMEIETLSRYYKTPDVAKQMEEMAELVVKGSLPHSLELVKFLFGHINLDALPKAKQSNERG